MLYDKISKLPDSVKDNLPETAQEIYKEAFNTADEDHQNWEEGRNHQYA
jgi:cation transport regulator